MTTTEQMHRVIAPSARIEQTRRRLAQLRMEGLVDHITLPQAGRTRAWFPTSRRATRLRMARDALGTRPPGPSSRRPGHPSRPGHWPGFVRAVSQRGLPLTVGRRLTSGPYAPNVLALLAWTFALRTVVDVQRPARHEASVRSEPGGKSAQRRVAVVAFINGTCAEQLFAGIDKVGSY